MTPFRFSKQDKLRKRREFVRLFEKPNFFRATLFQAFWKANSSANEKTGVIPRPRIGITLKGKTTSVTRTKLKRVVREWFRLNKNSFVPIDCNIVIRVPLKVDTLYVAKLREQLQEFGRKKLEKKA
ncbi:MAG: ribonuclease P protein component [Bacteriovoracia bacterium]